MYPLPVTESLNPFRNSGSSHFSCSEVRIPAGFSLGFIVAQLGALETVVGDFLRHEMLCEPLRGLDF
jgi:hypothetical protein